MTGAVRTNKLLSRLRAGLPPSVIGLIRRLRSGGPLGLGSIDFGDFGRLAPIGGNFGYERGTPIDRIYIESFLAKHAGLIQGRTLEVVNDDYTRRFGQAGSVHEVVDFRRTNAAATICGDLTKLGHEWDEAFDAIVLTQTLQLIFDVPLAMTALHRMLKPGGVLLMTVPGITSLDPAEYDTWYWSFTEASIARLSAMVFGEENVSIEVFGNVCSATSFLQGLAAEEMRAGTIEPLDRRYPVIIGVCARRGGER